MNISAHHWHEIFAELGYTATQRGPGWQLAPAAADALPLYAAPSTSWLNGQVFLIHTPQAAAEILAKLYRCLLEINERRLYLAKFALDAADGLLLSAEAPLTENYRPLTVQMVNALRRYAGDYGPIFQSVRLQDHLVWRESAAGQPRTDFDEYLLSPGGLFAGYLNSVREEHWWMLDRHPQGQCWRIGYKGQLRLFDQAFLKISASWVALEVSVLSDPVPKALKAAPASQAMFLRHLLRLNDEMHLAKFGLDTEGRLLLMVELPLAELDFPLFLLALRTLSNYLEQYAQELELLAIPERNPRLAQVLTRSEAWLAPPPCF